MRIPFCGGAYKERSLNINAQECINFYPVYEKTPSEETRVVLYPTPGRVLFVDLGAGSVRGLYSLNNTIYAVADNILYKILYDGTKTALGTLKTTTGRLQIIDNTVQVVINDFNYLYAYNLRTGVFTVVTDPAVPAAGLSSITYQDGYILGVVNNSRTVIQSNLLDATTYNALAFVSELTFTGNLIACFSDQREFFMMGNIGSEVRYNSGATPFAFDKVAGVVVHMGCRSASSIKRIDNSFVWLGSNEDNGIFVARLDGYTPAIISSPALNEALQRYNVTNDAIGDTYKEGNSQFYVLTFPTENVTWVWDASTQEWHRRSDFNVGRDIANCYANINGKNIIGDCASGKIYYLSQDYLDNNGATIQRIRTCQHQRADGKVIFANEIWVDIESGVGLTAGQGSNPLATLEVSRDGGHTWVSLGTASMGLIGNYRKRLLWKRVGRGRIFTLRLTISDPVRCYVIDAYARVQAGTK